MSYHNYISKISKEKYEKIKDMIFSEEERTNINYHSLFGERLYDFGNYTDFNIPQEYSKDFFTNPETQESMDDYEPKVITKEFLKEIILIYQDKVSSWYKKEKENIFPILDKVRQKNIFKRILGLLFLNYEDLYYINSLISNLNHRINGWNSNEFIDLDLDNPEITQSWRYEYAIFELIRIYKSFDWENDIMIYYGS